MGIISWLILGLIAGFIGSKIVNSSGQGLWLDIALGIVGAIVGGVLFSARMITPKHYDRANDSGVKIVNRRTRQ